MTLGEDRYWDQIQHRLDARAEMLPECDRCGRRHDEHYYATPEGDYCWRCAWNLAYDYVRDDEPDLATESEEFERLIDDYMDDWESSNEYEF